jgi:hypothetical protein
MKRLLLAAVLGVAGCRPRSEVRQAEAGGGTAARQDKRIEAESATGACSVVDGLTGRQAVKVLQHATKTVREADRKHRAELQGATQE